MARPRPVSIGLCCWVLLVSGFTACGGDIEAAAEASAALADRREIPPEVRAERARLTALVREERERLTALRAESQELEDRLGALGADSVSGPQASAWRDRLSEVRFEMAARRESLNAGLDAIARLSESF